MTTATYNGAASLGERELELPTRRARLDLAILTQNVGATPAL
jgi:hypothetical protein